MAWISFTVFDLGAAITGGALVNLGDAITILMEIATGSSGGQSTLLSILVGGIIGIIFVVMFPVHWLLQYRPDEPLYALAVVLPWILCTFISALLFAKTMKEGFLTGLFLGLGYMIMGIVVVVGLTSVLNSQAGGMGVLVNGLFMGLTDLPPVAAILLSCLEGGLIGGIFGALAGAIRYNPAEAAAGYQPKVKTGDAAFGSAYTAAPTSAPTSAPPNAPPMAYSGSSDTTKATDFCINCGAKLTPGVQFCMNCGNKI